MPHSESDTDTEAAFDDYFTPNTMNRIGPFTLSFPRHLPLPSLVRRCPNLSDHALRRLAASADSHSAAFLAIVIANLFPQAEQAVRQVVRAIPRTPDRDNLLAEMAQSCDTDGNYGPCDTLKAAFRAENGGRTPSYTCPPICPSAPGGQDRR